MNRAMRRKLSRNGGIEQIVADAVDNSLDVVRGTTRKDAYSNAFAAMLLALHQLHGFGYDQLHEVAVQTIRNLNNTLCATELIEMLKAATGFDVEEPLDDNELGMEVE